MAVLSTLKGFSVSRDSRPILTERQSSSQKRATEKHGKFFFFSVFRVFPWLMPLGLAEVNTKASLLPASLAMINNPHGFAFGTGQISPVALTTTLAVRR
jgi:hypothetical protein